jgi:hypothetical protein
MRVDATIPPRVVLTYGMFKAKGESRARQPLFAHSRCWR